MLCIRQKSFPRWYLVCTPFFSMAGSRVCMWRNETCFVSPIRFRRTSSLPPHNVFYHPLDVYYIYVLYIIVVVHFFSWTYSLYHTCTCKSISLLYCVTIHWVRRLRTCLTKMSCIKVVVIVVVFIHISFSRTWRYFIIIC